MNGSRHTLPNPNPGKTGRGRNGAGFTLLGLLSLSLLLAAPERPLVPLSGEDRALLDDVESRALLYFVDQTDARTGLTRDRAPADGRPGSAEASVAASGFAMAGWAIAAERGWIPPEAAKREVVTTLTFLRYAVEQTHGWFYHFVRTDNGRRAWSSEASTIDTALMLQGAIFVREYFHDPEITALVNGIYARIDWTWALNGGTTLTHGWRPETGFLPYRWDRYAEMMGMVLLGIGAPDHALPPESWDAWTRGPVVHYAGRTFFGDTPLFTYQYAHAFFDFRDRRDAHADYWENSVEATLAQRQWCADQSNRFPKWSLNLWGLTASDSVRGYKAWGTPDGEDEAPDGTLVPSAVGGSLPFAPHECLATLRQMREQGGIRVWKTYGFVDAFNPQTGWTSRDVIAIDQGIMLVMAENLRSGLIWRYFMQAPEVQRALKLAGFSDPVELEAQKALVKE